MGPTCAVQSPEREARLIFLCSGIAPPCALEARAIRQARASRRDPLLIDGQSLNAQRGMAIGNGKRSSASTDTEAPETRKQ